LLLPVSFAAVVLAASLLLLASASQGDEQPATSPTQPAGQMTLKKFHDVEVQKYPWGWIRWTMNAAIDNDSGMTFGVVYIKPHQTNPLHLHPKADEILHVVEGSCEHRMGDKWVKMVPGDTIRIPHGVEHNARTLDQACRVVVVYDTGQRKMVPVKASSPRGKETE
jgi:quercetin dioxygenase-like cupin family protein